MGPAVGRTPGRVHPARPALQAPPAPAARPTHIIQHPAAAAATAMHLVARAAGTAPPDHPSNRIPGLPLPPGGAAAHGPHRSRAGRPAALLRSAQTLRAAAATGSPGPATRQVPTGRCTRRGQVPQAAPATRSCTHPLSGCPARQLGAVALAGSRHGKQTRPGPTAASHIHRARAASLRVQGATAGT
jgi:hypothetical protein